MPISRMRQRRPEEVCLFQIQLDLHFANIGAPAIAAHTARSSEEQSQGCYPKTHSEIDGWSDYGYTQRKHR